MKQQRSGKIITVGSIAGTGLAADGGYPHYAAAKAAIAHYTRYFAQDLGPFGVTANCIVPGIIATGRILANPLPADAKERQDTFDLIALRRPGTIEECTNAIEFLATGPSDYVTGAVIPVDEGIWGG